MSQWKEHLRARRRQLEIELLYSGNRHLCSPLYYAQYRVTLPLIREHVKGKLIDLGCGDVPFKHDIEGLVTRYDTLDLFPKRADLTYVSDIQDMPSVPSGSYDSAICLEVLEHVADPFRAVREIHRILAPGGVLIISVPHLSRLHDLPHDYFRYTSFGLRSILEQAGFNVLCVRQRGGLLSFLGHQISTVLLATVWNWGWIRKAAWLVNSWLVTRICFVLDELLSLGEEFAAGYVVVAVKPSVDRNR
ncbi:MAG: class I SAM-dependent methyltransferase [Anaerolineae bacterium]